MERIRLIFLGPPGAGKGTQADKLQDAFGIVKISTGDILREAVNQGTTLGEIAKVYMERGELVPDDIIIGLVREKILQLDQFVLDGFPRNLAQAKALETIPAKKELVFLFKISKEELVKRLTSRLVCPKCKAVYNKISLPPKVDEICDICFTPLVKRSDDNEETIERRYKVWEAEEKALVDYYEKKGNLYSIDASLGSEMIFEKICSIIGKVDD